MEDENKEEAKKIQEQTTKEKPLKSFKIEARERREELALLIKRVGFFKAREAVKQISNKYGVSLQAVYKDFDWIKGHIPPANLREVKIELTLARSKALSEAITSLEKASTEDIKIKAIGILIAASKHYTEQMEAWGEKEKVADKHKIEGSMINIVESVIGDKDANTDKPVEEAKESP